MKKVERGKVCQFRCLSLKGNKNSQQVKPQDCRSQVAGKVVPPQAQGTTVQLSSEGTRNSCWTPQAQKKFSPFIWHRNKFFLFQVKEGKKKKKKTTEVSPGMPGFFFSKCLQAVFWFQGALSTNPTLSLCTWSTHSECSDCKCQHIFITAAQLFLSILPASLCLHFTTHSKGFLLCMRVFRKKKNSWPEQRCQRAASNKPTKVHFSGAKKKKFLGQNSHVCRPHANDSRERC